MDLPPGFIASLKEFGPHVVTTGLFLWYLVKRDAKTPGDSPEATGAASSAEKSAGSERTVRVEDAILEMARQSARQTEILGQQTSLLRECVQGHGETQKTLTEVKTRLEVMRVPPNGRA